MLPEPGKQSTPEVRPSPRPTSSERLLELFEAQRRASAELYAAVRNSLAETENLLPHVLLADNRRSRAQFEKAFELSRQADAKIDLLVSRFKGRS
jgi:hypothetical protein